MSKLNDKQMLVAAVVVPALLIGGVGYLTWLDYEKIHAAEITDEHPEAAEVTDPEMWGERRKVQEIEKEMAQLQGEADLIGKREQDVIVYREIVQRDSQILPDKELVTEFTKTVDDFARQSGVVVTSVGDLNTVGGAGQAIARLPIRLSLQGSYDQFLKFLNLFETMPRIVNTRGFGITAGQRMSEDPSEQVVHGIALELETYVYNPGAGLSKPVEITNYERRKDDPVIQKLVRQQKAARVESYQLKPRINRRDPLVDPRRAQAGTDDGGVTQKDYEEQRRTVERLRHEIETLKEDVRLETQYLQERKYLQYVQIKALNDEKIQSLEIQVKEADSKVAVPELREQFQDEVVSPFTKLAGDRTKKGEDSIAVVTATHVKPFLDNQRTAQESKDYERAARIFKELEDFLAQKNRRLAEDAAPLVAEMRENARQAGVMIEFVSMKLVVTGIIRRPQGSLVILNGKTVRPGDHVDDKARCRLTDIRDDALVFELDDCEISLPLKK